MSKQSVKFKAGMIRKSMPSPEKMERMRQQRIQEARQNPTCFTYWFPIVEQLGINHPRSLVLDFPDDLTGQIYNGEIEAADPRLNTLVREIRAFGKTVGYPLFMKNSLCSAKHAWRRTCFVDEGATDEQIKEQITHLTHYWGMASWEKALYLVVREFIPTAPVFHAFEGMPVTAEYRIFADDGKANGWQPYWPSAAIESPSVSDWEARLATIREPSSEDLDRMQAWASDVSSALGGAWSIDFLRGRDGQLWLIDIAEAAKSYWNKEEYRELN